jgi:hypothetical protein
MESGGTEPSFVRRHRVALIVGGVVGLGLAAWLAFGFFGVQALFLDDEVDEAGPVFESGATLDEEPATDEGPADEPTATTAPAPTIVTLAAGDFSGRGSYSAEGRASVLNDGSEQRFLRFTEFATDNGPDLNVYLSAAAPDADPSTFDDDFVDLGDLSGNIGDQNYELPPDVDLDRYGTVVIWCVRFSAAFGAAPLDAA